MKDVTILVVDDDEEIAELVEIYLTNDGYYVEKAYDGEQCLKKLEENKKIKLIILDIMMPNIDGLEVCRKIRKTSNIPIIMLSAKAEDMDKIIGFGTGADDYMTKPFNPLELMARVKSQLKRYTNLNLGMDQVQDETGIQIQDLIINRKAHKVHKNEVEINLTPIEFEILYLLSSNVGRVFGTDEIFERVWNEKVYEVNNTVMVHIRRLREKIEDNPRSPKILKTVWGVGYKVEE